MKDFLVLTLYAPLMSFGEAARGHRVRGTDRIPTKSQLIGMAGAALGLERKDPELKNLHQNLSVAARADSYGAILRDYQTIQTAANNTAGLRTLFEGRETVSRRDFLQNARRKKVSSTMLSNRFYIENGLFTVAYEGPLELLERLQRAFREPGYPLYIGRKPNALGAFPRPQVVRAETPLEALERRDSFAVIAEEAGIPREEIEEVLGVLPGSKVIVAYEANRALSPGSWEVIRRDHCLDPESRVFVKRKEYREFK